MANTLWQCTPKMQRDLIRLHEENKTQWHNEIIVMAKEHREKFPIFNIDHCSHPGGSYLWDFDDFTSYFDGVFDNKTLLKLIFDDIKHTEYYTDTKYVKFRAVYWWLTRLEVRKMPKCDKYGLPYGHK